MDWCLFAKHINKVCNKMFIKKEEIYLPHKAIAKNLFYQTYVVTVRYEGFHHNYKLYRNFTHATLYLSLSLIQIFSHSYTRKPLKLSSWMLILAYTSIFILANLNFTFFYLFFYLHYIYMKFDETIKSLIENRLRKMFVQSLELTDQSYEVLTLLCSFKKVVYIFTPFS